MERFLNQVTAEHACEILGLTRIELLELLSQDKLKWTMGQDKKTTLIELPADIPGFLCELRGHRQTLSVLEAAAELSVTRSAIYVFLDEGKLKRTRTERVQITRDSLEALKSTLAAKRKASAALDTPLPSRNHANSVTEQDAWSQRRSR